MELAGLTFVVAAYFVFALISGRLEGLPVTAPMVFVALGFVVGPGVLDLANVNPGHGFLHVVAEITLVLLLFTDAARIDLSVVKRDHNLPVRMLAIGLPLAIALGALAGAWILPELGLWGIALLAALLAPTDAALGQAVVSNPAVPVRIRQAINIESGLNDGIALPAVLVFAALASAMHGGAESGDWVRFALLQVTLGPVVGIALGYAGARLIDTAVAKHWCEEAYQGMAILALAGLCYLAAEFVGGNGFIAAFVGGMSFGNSIRNDCAFLFEFMETEGQLLMLITFLVFGTALLPEAIAHFEPVYVVYALVSLTVVRMLPVALSLLGSGVRVPTMLFLGWFGPRGLASILFVLLILEEADVPQHEAILAITVITVALSTLLHGITAAPLALWFGRKVEDMGDCEESKPAQDMPLRTGMLGAEVTIKKEAG